MNFNELKKFAAAFCSSSVGVSAYPSVAICIAFQKMGPHTSGDIPIGGNTLSVILRSWVNKENEDLRP